MPQGEAGFVFAEFERWSASNHVQVAFESEFER